MPGTDSDSDSSSESEAEYLKQREARIASNNDKLLELGLGSKDQKKKKVSSKKKKIRRRRKLWRKTTVGPA